jgi:phosphatidylserine/phosphatidylglycerophosphate/cardiolipin synthase-like enzyme
MANLQVQWFDKKQDPDETPLDVIHMKLMIADEITICGSTNLDLAGLHNCHETNIVIDSADFAKRAYEAIFFPNFQTSIEAKVDFEPFRLC